MIRQVYIPIEVKNRELKSRLLVLYFLLKKGHKCIIGDKAGVYRYMINNPGGIYYDKSISKNKIAFIKKIKKIARHFVCSDEELGITYNNIESFFKFIQIFRLIIFKFNFNRQRSSEINYIFTFPYIGYPYF